jgi:hypothetical protein
MQKLSVENRTLLIEYYQDEGQAKINRRKRLAKHLGIAINALRIRAYRVRATLLECVTNCLHEAMA